MIFLPLIFVRGVAGVLFQELSLVIIFSLVCSLLVSLSLLPMLASRLLQTPEQLTDTALALDRAPDRLGPTACSRGWTMPIATCCSGSCVIACARSWWRWPCSGASLLLLPFIGTEFMPPSDEGEVRVTGEMEIGTRLDLLDAQARKMENIVYQAVPETVSSVISVGSSGWRPSDAAKSRDPPVPAPRRRAPAFQHRDRQRPAPTAQRPDCRHDHPDPGAPGPVPAGADPGRRSKD